MSVLQSSNSWEKAFWVKLTSYIWNGGKQGWFNSVEVAQHALAVKAWTGGTREWSVHLNICHGNLLLFYHYDRTATGFNVASVGKEIVEWKRNFPTPHTRLRK